MQDVDIKPIMIISAELPGFSDEENNTRTNTLESCLEEMGVGFKSVWGKHNGQDEDGFLVVLNNGIQLDDLKTLAFERFGQQSVFVSDMDRNSYVHNSDGSIVGVGKLISTTDPDDIYTYCPALDTYYTTKD